MMIIENPQKQEMCSNCQVKIPIHLAGFNKVIAVTSAYNGNYNAPKNKRSS